jgi:hypothetical protein
MLYKRVEIFERGALGRSHNILLEHQKAKKASRSSQTTVVSDATLNKGLTALKRITD